jgi:hypothetical protein
VLGPRRGSILPIKTNYVSADFRAAGSGQGVS